MLLIILVFLFVFSVFTGSAFSADNIRITVNGETVDTGKNVPILKNGVTFLPLRATANILNCETYWD